MGVICHGLSLPLSEHETIKDCVNVYCEWLTALLPAPRISVPKPICEDPNLYARKMIGHLHNLFVPRHGEGEQHNGLTAQCFPTKQKMNVCFRFTKKHSNTYTHTRNNTQFANVYIYFNIHTSRTQSPLSKPILENARISIKTKTLRPEIEILFRIPASGFLLCTVVNV